MHPLRTYINKLKAEAPDRASGRQQVLALAAKVGVDPILFNNITNPNQLTSNIAPVKALRMELYTKGEVLAVSVCPKLHERIEEARRIVAMADRQGY
jgi:hypothetical protein